MTRGGEALTSTILTLSERWFTTQTSPALRTATATGSNPTYTELSDCKPASVTVKMSSDPLGKLATNNRLPSADKAKGRTGPDSKV